MLATLKKELSLQIAVGFFILLTVWWFVLYSSDSTEGSPNLLFGATYGLMAIWGGVWGLYIAKKWGGFKSVMGKAMIVLSLGLLAAEFGQLVFSFYNVFLGVEIPYPSLADVGFFANIPLYIWGILLLSKASGVRLSKSSLSHKIQVILLPVIVLTLSYVVFLKGYEFDWTDPLKVFLDFGYPLGQSIYFSIALLTYTLSQKVLGGIMRSKILFLLFAFGAQYLADYNFLLQNSQGTWYNGGYGDYLYLIAYFLMTLGLIQLKSVLDELRDGH